MKAFSVLVLMGFTLLLIGACGGGPPEPPEPPPPPSPTPTPCGPDEPGAFGVRLQDPGGSGKYMFGPSELSFGIGEAVAFKFCAETEFHTFTVEDLGIDVGVDAGSPETLSFTFDQPGTFQIICTPHEALGMVGTITIR